MANDDVQTAGLREYLLKEALAEVDWRGLRSHLDSIDLSEDTLVELCGHIRRYSDWIAKYPHKGFEKRRERFFSELARYAGQRLGARAPQKVTAVLALINLIEHGYRAILDVLDKCAIGKQPPAVRVDAPQSPRSALALGCTCAFEFRGGSRTERILGHLGGC